LLKIKEKFSINIVKRFSVVETFTISNIICLYLKGYKKDAFECFGKKSISNREENKSFLIY